MSHYDFNTDPDNVYKWEGWNRCDEVMPDISRDWTLGDPLAYMNHEFLICYHFKSSPSDPFLARCYLSNGKFITDEWCHADGCPDECQDEFWKDEKIVITHWMHLSIPEDYYDKIEKKRLNK
jgi:hypothetical protein